MKHPFTIPIVVFAVIILGAIGFKILSNHPNNDQADSMSTSDLKDQRSDTGHTSTLDNLTGDAYDEEFIAQMLAHHEGAVNMSEQAMGATSRVEIRDFADSITQSQSKEMMDMRAWQKQWGYEITNSGGHMSHGGGGTEMAGDMTEMMAKLQGLTGEAFDREFLAQMIVHHQQALDMVTGAESRAKHDEIKKLARDIAAVQDSEITQMKRWQTEWGY